MSKTKIEKSSQQFYLKVTQNLSCIYFEGELWHLRLQTFDLEVQPLRVSRQFCAIQTGQFRDFLEKVLSKNGRLLHHLFHLQLLLKNITNKQQSIENNNKLKCKQHFLQTRTMNVRNIVLSNVNKKCELKGNK